MTHCLRSVRFVAWLVALLALAATAAPARAQDHGKVAMDPTAREHLDRGLEYYGKQEYEAAIDEFEDGYAIDPRPTFLFAMAQAERLSGDCGSAVVLYREFLATNPPAMHAEAAQGSLTKCETALASRPAGSKEPVGAPEAPEGSAEDQAELAPDPEEPNASRSLELTSTGAAGRGDSGPWYKDTVAVTLLGLGVAGIGVGATFTALSFSSEGDADSASSLDEYRNSLDTAESQRVIGLAALGVGTALVAGAAVKYFVFGDSAEPTDGLTVAPTRQGAAVVWTGRW